MFKRSSAHAEQNASRMLQNILKFTELMESRNYIKLRDFSEKVARRAIASGFNTRRATLIMSVRSVFYRAAGTQKLNVQWDCEFVR